MKESKQLCEISLIITNAALHVTFSHPILGKSAQIMTALTFFWPYLDASHCYSMGNYRESSFYITFLFSVIKYIPHDYYFFSWFSNLNCFITLPNMSTTDITANVCHDCTNAVCVMMKILK